MENKPRCQAVNIRFASAGARPPIYVAGSFTIPEWVPREMDYHLDPESRESVPNYIFSKSFDLLPGRYSYKLRLGDGDWWVCDDRVDTVEDSSGNLNNLLIVEEPEPDPEQAEPQVKHNPSNSEKLAIPEKVTENPSIVGEEGHDLVKEPFSPSRSERTSDGTMHQPSLPEGSHGGSRRRLVGDHSSSVTQVTASNSSASSSPPLETFWERFLHWLRSIWLALCGGTRK